MDSYERLLNRSMPYWSFVGSVEYLLEKKQEGGITAEQLCERLAGLYSELKIKLKENAA